MAFDFKNAAPDFFVIGAAKAGSTAVWSWLRQHPDVFMTDVKEPGFFACDGPNAVPVNGPYDKDHVRSLSTSPSEYKALFQEAGDKVTGDVSPIYLNDVRASFRIAWRRPDARIIILLRDPVDRAYSQYLHHRRDGLEPCETFECALLAERERIQSGWSWGHAYTTAGRYASKVEHYLNLFHPSQILFLDYAQLRSEAEVCWEKICHHINVAPFPMPELDIADPASNLPSLKRYQWIERAVRHPGQIQRWAKSHLPSRLRSQMSSFFVCETSPIQPMHPQTRANLASLFAKDREWLRRNTGLSLSGWAG
ncbi:sulfotransferase domain-containing protein [Actibacterium pelagium]|uniref:Sulfotransferase domain-containing protein n=1 Tax=Actibacterium pelagium TaxID=2029103 RepID=A0A917A9X0_9RHOB|nr:sulfotransferase domain-containing protein [Actibacterium pelagium]GGE36361.1 hypothetical protein GCM10011517_00150 [Actibacterium pelagium]